MQCYWGQASSGAATGIGIGFDALTGSTFTGPLATGDIGYFMVVTNTTTALPTPAGWTLVSSGTLASGGKWGLWRRALIPADTWATTFSLVQCVSGASGIWGCALLIFRATKLGTLAVQGEAVNNNAASTLIAVPAFTSSVSYVLAVALSFIDFQQSLDTIVPSRNEYTARSDTKGTGGPTNPTPMFLAGAPQSKTADSWKATASVASVVATIAISETGTSGRDVRSTVEAKSARNVITPSGNSNINVKSTIEARPLKGTPSDVDKLSGSQTYGGGVQIL